MSRQQANLLGPRVEGMANNCLWGQAGVSPLDAALSLPARRYSSLQRDWAGDGLTLLDALLIPWYDVRRH